MQSDELMALLQTGLAVSAAPATEITVVQSDKQALRFAATQVTQNVTLADWRIWFRVVDRGRIGIAETNCLTEKGLRRAAEQAWASAKVQTVQDDYQLPAPVYNGSETVPGGLDPADSLEKMLAGSFATLEQAAWTGAGSLSFEQLRIGIANTNGLKEFHQEPRFGFNCIAARGARSGYAGVWAHRLSRADLQRTTAEAIDWGELDSHMLTLDSGDYEVVLSPYATADLLWLLQYMGFSARAVLEERSFLIGRFGQQVMAEAISIWDDAADRRGFYWSFDWEGVARRKVRIIQDGVALSPVYDTWTGLKLGQQSTGHAIPAVHGGSGPYPAHLVLAPGRFTPAELLATVRQGIYINRFHYTNVVDPRRALVTGMTRDGTYLVRDGKIVGRIPNLRFTDDLLRACSTGVLVGQDTRLVHDGDTGFLVPSLKLGSLRFL